LGIAPYFNKQETVLALLLDMREPFLAYCVTLADKPERKPRPVQDPDHQILGRLEHVFRVWLELSSEDEIRALLTLIQQEFRRRGYHLKYAVERGEGRQEGTR